MVITVYALLFMVHDTLSDCYFVFKMFVINSVITF